MLASTCEGRSDSAAGCCRLLLELDDALVGIDAHHAKLHRLLSRHLDAVHRERGATARVLVEHYRVVHLVDMVAAEDQHDLGPRLAQQVQVLVDGIGGAGVPVLAVLLLRRRDLDILAQAGGQKVPAALDVADQALRLVLRQHGNAARPS